MHIIQYLNYYFLFLHRYKKLLLSPVLFFGILVIESILTNKPYVPVSNYYII